MCPYFRKELIQLSILVKFLAQKLSYSCFDMHLNWSDLYMADWFIIVRNKSDPYGLTADAEGGKGEEE